MDLIKSVLRALMELMMPPRKKKSNDLFFMTFVGEFVSILSNMDHTAAIQTEEGTVEETAPMVFQGYMLDMDEEYYYLGETQREVSRAIKKVSVNAIEISDHKDEFTDLLDKAEAPSNKKNFN